ncbi:MAG: hypothetical protein RSB97_08495 [Christensenella sp.]
MKKKIVFVILIMVSLIICASCQDENDLSNTDSYSGFPVYKFDVESKTVMIDGVLYKEIASEPKDFVEAAEDFIGYIWYEPHPYVKKGVSYRVYPKAADDGSREYLCAYSAAYMVRGTPHWYDLYLQKAD